MSYFETKMHQIRFRLGLRPRPRWGSSQRSPSWILGVLLLREGDGGEGKRGEEGGKRGWGGRPPILLPRLTACLAVSSVIPGTLCRYYGWSGSTASVHMLRLLLLLSVGPQSVSDLATVTAVSESSVSAVVSVTVITGLQLRRHFRLRLKPDNLVSVGL